MTVALFDPSIASENLGDEIIRDAVTLWLGRLLPDEQIVTIPSQIPGGRRARRIAREARYRIVGGSNLLTSHMLRYRQWAVGLRDAPAYAPALLMGVGWWQYQEQPDRYTRAVLRHVLARDGLHAARDRYTADRLRAIGIANVVNTACPTMWELDRARCAAIPGSIGSAVLMTLTDYHRDPARDRFLAEALHAAYGAVLFWPQGAGDMAYAREIGLLETVETVPASLAAFDALLREREVDFVGTRLHAGVRALQHGRRALIIGIDNRGLEIARDTGLPVLPRDEIDRLPERLRATQAIRIELPGEAIARWQAQFAR